MVLFMRNWIRSGVNKISDLHLVDGKLDLIRMYDIIVFKLLVTVPFLHIESSVIPPLKAFYEGLHFFFLH